MVQNIMSVFVGLILMLMRFPRLWIKASIGENIRSNHVILLTVLKNFYSVFSDDLKYVVFKPHIFIDRHMNIY